LTSLLELDPVTRRDEFAVPSGRPNIDIRLEKELHIGPRKDLRADIPSLCHY
jgi:hypothetical protein